MRIAIIPARGGSKGLPRKSVLPLAGKPLIVWTIEAALSSEQFDLVLVSTEDAEIAGVASRCEEVRVIDRPKNLATDEASSLDVVVHALETVSADDADTVVLLQPTSPLRNAEDIRKALRQFSKGGHDSLISVAPLDRKMNWAYCLENGSLRPLSADASNRRQGLPDLFIPNGAIYVSRVGDLLLNDSFVGETCAAYIMPEVRSVDIDTAEDLRRAERLLEPFPVVRIGEREIGTGRPVYIIAEAGVNHNGDVDLALRMVDAAAQAGADAIKFQTFKAEKLIARGARKAEYQEDGSDEDQLQMVKRLELEEKDFARLQERCMERGIEFLSTPFDLESLNALVGMGMKAVKVPSGELNNLRFLEKVRDADLPVILSTGMGDLDEIERAVRLFRSAGVPLILLQCTTSYPAPFETLNLRVIVSLRERFNLPTGLSDHSQGMVAPIAAAALGACVVEKHFTLDKEMRGPDHQASLDPEELERMISSIRTAEKALGDGAKRPFPQEMELAKAARRSVVAATDIPKGTVVSAAMLTVKRPGTGIPPDELGTLIGMRAKVNIKTDQLLERGMLE